MLNPELVAAALEATRILHPKTLMITRDYTQEIGVASQKKTVPRFVAIAVLAVVAIGLSFGVASVVRQTREHNAIEKKASSAPTVAPAVAPVTAPEAKP